MLLKEAQNENAAAKIALFGPQGSGKTSTAVQIAIGLSLEHHKSAPVAFFDTEKGSDFSKRLFDAEGIKLLQVKSRAFTDLITTVKDAETSGACCLIVDSMTHVWNELMEAFCRRKQIRRIEFQHWRELKETWRSWTDLMLNSPLHMLIAGRAGWVYRYEDTETEGGKTRKELITDGTKFKAEGEFGYEPDVLVELWIDREEGNERGSKIIHKGIVLKDRTWAINGFEFQWKDRTKYNKGDWKMVYDCFRPFISNLNIGGKQRAIDSERSSDELINPEGDTARYAELKRKKVALEEVENHLVLLWPGQDQKSKRIKLLVIRSLFGVTSWAAVENERLEKIDLALRALQEFQGLTKQSMPIEENDVLATLSDAKHLASQPKDMPKDIQPALASKPDPSAPW